MEGQLGRVKIVVTARPVLFDDNLIKKHLPIPILLEEFDGVAFADVVTDVKGKNNKRVDPKNNVWRRVELLPLSNSQILHFATIDGVMNPAELLADLQSRNAEELRADWRVSNRIRSHSEQVEANVVSKLKPRCNREEKSQLTSEATLEAACRLALAVLMTRKLHLRHNIEADACEVSGALEPMGILTDWSAVDCQTLLERALFGFAGYGRVRFHHRSVVEYLAIQNSKFSDSFF